jgi:hypothetical protein
MSAFPDAYSPAVGSALSATHFAAELPTDSSALVAALETAYSPTKWAAQPAAQHRSFIYSF